MTMMHHDPDNHRDDRDYEPGSDDKPDAGGAQIDADALTAESLAGGPVLPDYQNGCVTTIMPALLFGSTAGTPFPDEVVRADQIVLLVIDGLGDYQLRTHSALAPRLTSMDGAAVTSVIPSTTSSALTSITTGVAPGEHGIVGYRIAVDGEILNALRWTTPRGDARSHIAPDAFQAVEPFLGQRATVVTGSEYKTSGFTRAHLDGADFRGYRTTASLVYEVGTALDRGERFVFAYYNGLDVVGHEHGHDGHYRAEIGFVDQLVDAIADRLPTGAALVVTADHGQVASLPPQPLHPEVSAEVAFQSGEARLRWLHCRPGFASACADAARAHHADHAWVASVDEVLEAGWLGRNVTGAARARLGDVALAAKGRHAFADPDEGGPELIGRHGSLTPAEMMVPLRWTVG